MEARLSRAGIAILEARISLAYSRKSQAMLRRQQAVLWLLHDERLLMVLWAWLNSHLNNSAPSKSLSWTRKSDHGEQPWSFSMQTDTTPVVNTGTLYTSEGSRGTDMDNQSGEQGQHAPWATQGGEKRVLLRIDPRFMTTFVCGRMISVPSTLR